MLNETAIAEPAPTKTLNGSPHTCKQHHFPHYILKIAIESENKLYQIIT